MLITLEYATVILTVKPKNRKSEIDAILLCGTIIQRSKDTLNWGKPSIKVNVNPLCPKCSQRMTEGSPDDSFFHCEKCGTTQPKEKAKT